MMRVIMVVVLYGLASTALAEDAIIEVNGHINSKITVAINPTQQWDFGLITPEASPSRADTLQVNSNRKWSVTASDVLTGYAPAKPSGTKGHMVQWTGSYWIAASQLTDSLKITNDATNPDIQGGGVAYDLASDPVIASSTKKGTFNIPVTLTQWIRFTDDPTTGSNYYRMIVTFTGAQNIF